MPETITFVIPYHYEQPPPRHRRRAGRAEARAGRRRWAGPRERARPMANAQKYVYSFGGGRAEGRADMKDLLGGKGANLAEMSPIGIPVPPGFTITTEVCADYYQ